MNGRGGRGPVAASSLRIERPARSEESEAGVGEVVEQTRRIREDLEGLASAVFATRSSWESSLRERLTERPYVGLATAAGLGYVLGAGVSPALLRVAVGLGSRVAFAVVMRRLAVPLTEAIAGRAP